MNVREAMTDTLELARKHGMDTTEFEEPHVNYEHLADMVRRAYEMDSSKYGKLCRWLGYIQGVVAASGLGISLEQLKDINRRHADKEPSHADDT